MMTPAQSPVRPLPSKLRMLFSWKPSAWLRDEIQGNFVEWKLQATARDLELRDVHEIALISSMPHSVE